MPELFTLTELQTIYEIILGQTLEKKSFRRRTFYRKQRQLRKQGNKKLSVNLMSQLFRYALMILISPFHVCWKHRVTQIIKKRAKAKP